MRYIEGLDTPGRHDRGFSSGSQVNRDQSGLSYHLHYRETYAPASPEHVQSPTFGLLVESSLFRLNGWFHIHFFIFIYLRSKVASKLKRFHYNFSRQLAKMASSCSMVLCTAAVCKLWMYSNAYHYQ